MKKMIIILAAIFVVESASKFDPKNHENWMLLRHDICGHVNSERIIGGQEAPMNAYPWMAMIGYVVSGRHQYEFRCSGVVANSQTVLTAAHCITNLPKHMKVAVIRLGEHNSETNPDCEDDFCADPVVDVNPKEIIIPRNYNERPFKHDIALIRLHKKIQFTAFVKPICFASGEFYHKDLVGSIGEVAGWGIFDIDNLKSSSVLQVVKLSIIKNEECHKRLPRYVKIGRTQLCVGGIVGQDSCNGDSGGPLMKVDDSNGKPCYYLLGIVSFGSKKCGKTDMPGVYTNMAAYMRWFLDNLNETTSESQSVF